MDHVFKNKDVLPQCLKENGSQKTYYTMFDNKILGLPCRSTTCKKKCKSIVQRNVVHCCSRYPSSETYLGLLELGRMD